MNTITVWENAFIKTNKRGKKVKPLQGSNPRPTDY